MEAIKKKIAIYPGSFNPFTIGHLNVLEKAEAIFGIENVIIAVGVNPEKSSDTTDKVATIKHNLPSKNVESYAGFLTDYIWSKEKEGFDVTVIRGLRNSFDLQYETNLLRAMQDFKPDIKSMMFLCDKEFDHVSSSLYRSCEKDKPGSGLRYLAKECPTAKQVGNDICVVFLDTEKILNTEKYVVVSKTKINDKKYKFEFANILDKYEFEGTYVECLSWIKEQISGTK